MGRSRREATTGSIAETSRASEPPAVDPGPAPDLASLKEFVEPLVLAGSPRLGSQPRSYSDTVHQVPDSVMDGGEVDGLEVRAASMRGDDHRYFGETRQDSFSVWNLATADQPSPALLVAVADGVGSEKLSHLGSAAACRHIADELATHLAAILDPKQESQLAQCCQRAVEAVAGHIEAEAHERAISPKSMSTTLVGALMGTRTETGARRAVLFGVGDSSAFILRDGDFQTSIGPAGGFLAGDATEALPTNVGQVQVMVADLRPHDMVLVCTDGLANPMRDAGVRKQLARWWQAKTAPGMAEFFWQISFRAQSFGDDRTAVCVWVR